MYKFWSGDQTTKHKFRVQSTNYKTQTTKHNLEVKTQTTKHGLGIKAQTMI